MKNKKINVWSFATAKLQAKINICLLILIFAVIGFSIVACGDDEGEPPSSVNLPSSYPVPQSTTYRGTAEDGSIYTLKITENTAARYVAKTGDTYVLTITKTGEPTKTSSGTVTTITADTLTLTPTRTTDTFTVTVSGSSITAISGTITFTDGNEPQDGPTDITPTLPEELPDAERWSSWIESSNPTATINHSVDAEGVCTITIGGTPQPNRWDLKTGYSYTAQANNTYKYTFEAWTQSGNRSLGVQYYSGLANGNTDNVFLGKEIDISTEHKTYMINGQKLPKGQTQQLEFQGADQLGTFYVKIISIALYTPEELPDAERWTSWTEQSPTATIIHSVDAEDVCTITIGGTAQSSSGDGWKATAGYIYTAQASTTYKYTFEAWTESGNRTLDVQYYNGFTNGNNDNAPLRKDVSITNQRQTYTINGNSIPKGGPQQLQFNSANQLGTFYVKITSITTY